MEVFFEKLSQEGPFEWGELGRSYTAHGIKLVGPPIEIA